MCSNIKTMPFNTTQVTHTRWLFAYVVLLLTYQCTPAFSISFHNSYLADSVWPIAQYDLYAQASTQLEGPLSLSSVDTLFRPELAGPLTLLYTQDNKAVWGSSFSHVFKVDRSGPELRLIDAIEKDRVLRFTDTFHGIYCLLSAEGIFYMQAAYVLIGYMDEIPGDSLSGIREYGRYDITNLTAFENENIQAISIVSSGDLVFVTTNGGLGVISRDLKTLYDFIYISKVPVTVTNSVSVDMYDGIYVVSSAFLHRIWWDKASHRLFSTHSSTSMTPAFKRGCDEEFFNFNVAFYRLTAFARSWLHCQTWSTPYPIDDTVITGRPTKVGSGTTPTLIYKEELDKYYVAIADGKRRQQVLVFDAESGQVVAAAAVTFSVNAPDEESYTEQSILIHENRLLVTQNALTAPAKRLNSLLMRLDAPEWLSNSGAPPYFEENVYLLPVILGDSPRGYQQFELQLKGNTAELLTTWRRDDIGCPNSIPTMSVPTGVMYCVAKEGMLGNYPLNGFSGAWSIEALNWTTGETIFNHKMGNSFLYNSFYAATQIGPEKEILYGSLGGIVRSRSATRKDAGLMSHNFSLQQQFVSLNPLETVNYLRDSFIPAESRFFNGEVSNLNAYSDINLFNFSKLTRVSFNPLRFQAEGAFMSPGPLTQWWSGNLSAMLKVPSVDLFRDDGLTEDAADFAHRLLSLLLSN